MLIVGFTVGCAAEPSTQATLETRVVAATGGTVTAGDATLVIPPGALSEDTTITVTVTTPGSSLPDATSIRGQIFDFGPDGTTFSKPATLTLPGPGTPGVGERAVISWLDPAYNQWADTTSTVTGDRISAPIFHFTEFAARVGVEPVNEPTRVWTFYEYLGDGHGPRALPPSNDDLQPGQGEQTGGGELLKVRDLGPLSFPLGGGEDGLIAQDEVFSSADGVTYWVSVQAPRGTMVDPSSRIGGRVEFNQRQGFRKNTADASLKIVVTKAFVHAIDNNSPDLLYPECPWLPPCGLVIFGDVEFDATAYAAQPVPGVEPFLAALPGTFFRTGGDIHLEGFQGDWSRRVDENPFARTQLWTEADFEFNPDVSGLGGHEAILTLRAPRKIEVDLSKIAVGQEFTLSMDVTVYAISRRGRESHVEAFFRDPFENGGAELEIVGLEPTNRPIEIDRPPPEPIPCASGPDPAAGALELTFETDATPEVPGGEIPHIAVARTGGSSGEVTATYTFGDETAIAGTDYAPFTGVVRFADGDNTPQRIFLPLVFDSLAEPDETVNLTLTEAGGCAALGERTTAEVTILDDDRPEPSGETFTVGGTVNGLEGSGLVLQEVTTGVQLTPTNGGFTFGFSFPSGSSYEVRVLSQPTNPFQVCSVANATGTITFGDVTNVAVSCVTQQPSGGLDPGFGDAGKVTVGVPGGAVATALQGDGKILVLGKRTLARYEGDGDVDGSFGTGGVVDVDFGRVISEAQALAIQPDGKIVVGGFTGVGSALDFAVARYETSGSPDLGFGTDGKLTTDFVGFADKARAVLLQADGRIVVAGTAGNDFGVARYTGGGALDASFGTGGKVTTNIAGTDLASAAALSPDGKILVAGRVAMDGTAPADVGLVRYDASGAPDPGFGDQGIVRADLASWDEATDVTVQPDGTLVVSVMAQIDATFQFMVARFDAGGDLDLGFGESGVATTSFSTGNDVARALALQPDGKIVLVGDSSSLPDFLIARFDAGGALDASFGDGGKLSVDFFNASDGATCVAVQPDGKIVVGGSARNGNSTGLGLLRALP